MAHFLDELTWRGLIQDQSDPKVLRDLGKDSAFYLGLDPTAPSLHLGNLVPIIVAAHIGRGGFQPIILFGGATGSIGDPSGKSEERPLLSADVINANVKRQEAQVAAIFERVKIKATFVNNLDWTKNVTVLHFLRDIGKYFTVNYMIAKEVVRARLEGEGISYTEFSYMLLQAFDFLHLYSSMNCKLQIGGSDQWGNITAGLELIRKKGAGEAAALSVPLLTNSQGKKFGKSESGAIWLDAGMTSPFKLHQYLVNVADEDVARLLKTFTFFSQDEIKALESEVKAAPEKRIAQRKLADEVCTLIHGAEATRDAQRGAEVLFGGSVEGVPEKQLEEIFSDVPSSTFSRKTVSDWTTTDLLVQSGSVKSKGDAKKLIQNGGAYLNSNRIADIGTKVSDLLAKQAGLIVLRTGKKSYHLVRLTD